MHGGVSCSSDIIFQKIGKKSCQQVATVSYHRTFCERARVQPWDLHNKGEQSSRRLDAVSYEQLGSCAVFVEAHMECVRKKVWDLHENISLHIMSKNEVTSEKIPSEDQGPTASTTANGKAESTDGRSNSESQRFGRFCHRDAVGRFTSSSFFRFLR